MADHGVETDWQGRFCERLRDGGINLMSASSISAKRPSSYQGDYQWRAANSAEYCGIAMRTGSRLSTVRIWLINSSGALHSTPFLVIIIDDRLLIEELLVGLDRGEPG